MKKIVLYMDKKHMGHPPRHQIVRARTKTYANFSCLWDIADVLMDKTWPKGYG